MSLGKKQIAIAALAVTTFLALPFSHAADPEIISETEAASLGLDIPKSTPAGHQIVTIEVTDASGNSVVRDIAFCKAASGKIYWNNVCPEVASPTPSQTLNATPTPFATETPKAVVKKVKSTPLKSWQKLDIGFGAVALLAAFFISDRARKRKDYDLHIIALAFEIDFIIFIGDALIGHSFILWIAAAVFGGPRLRKLLKLNQVSMN